MRDPTAAYRAVLFLRLSRSDDNPDESESIQNQRYVKMDQTVAGLKYDPRPDVNLFCRMHA